MAQPLVKMYEFAREGCFEFRREEKIERRFVPEQREGKRRS
jgi:hypothetical protein